ncbi:hypothetical protein HWV62_8154 [Athelia sp. TMB]|nr:hypothetical protein HWV62_8154 [Athelia sp. TMB]
MASLSSAEWTARQSTGVHTTSAEEPGNPVGMRREWPAGRPKFLPSDIPAPRTLEEAACILNLAHTSRNIKETQRKLARQHAKECRYLARLYELQAGCADAWLGEADLDVGQVTSAVRHNGTFAPPSPAMALRRHRSQEGLHRTHRSTVFAVHLD